MKIEVGQRLPQDITFHMRVRDENMAAQGDENPYIWQMVNSTDLFKDKRVVLFSLPGAFTPTCSTYQLPDYDNNYELFKSNGIDEVYCLSVNDSFVMNKWADWLDIDNVTVRACQPQFCCSSPVSGWCTIVVISERDQLGLKG